MKLIFIVSVILALSGVALGLKDPICFEEPGVDGPCRAYIPMFTCYPDRNECEEFIYGGCQGNHNRFWTKAECEAKCKDNPLYYYTNQMSSS